MIGSYSAKTYLKYKFINSQKILNQKVRYSDSSPTRRGRLIRTASCCLCKLFILLFSVRWAKSP